MQQDHERQVSLTVGEGFDIRDKENLTNTLFRLLPYVEGDYCVAGSVAMQAHLAAHDNEPLAPRKLNDVDLVMRRLEDINPAISTDFILWHLHPDDPVDGFYAALVDRINGLKVDIFGWQRFPPEREVALFEGNAVYIRSSADLSIVLISAMYRRMTTGMPMIRKQLVDAQALLAITSPDAIEHLWRPPDANNSITALDAFSAVQRYTVENPACFPEKSTKVVSPNDCSECADSGPYQVASSEEKLEARRVK